jgi:3,4-dihydroxy 2-butanone 4-phosphate synthase/GTP cyclohydrolase II
VSEFSSIEAVVAAVRAGKNVIVVDAEDRENEGDFICAAEKVTPAIVNFMITHGRGQLCMPILPDVSERLKLGPMVELNNAPLGTGFTVPVDHRSAKTGITAGERATTILSILDPLSKPTDFVRPGHLFPLSAKEGGVLRRAGHTESAVDLARLAGLYPAGVLCEILNADGDRATREELFALARAHDLEITTIDALIEYRRQREKLVERIAESRLPTRYGLFKLIFYNVKYESQQPHSGQPQILEQLDADAVVARIDFVTERQIGFHSVHPLILERVGFDFFDEPDPSTLLRQINQDARPLPTDTFERHVQLVSAIATE